MDITQTITLALIQGLTEFLPVSSSAHLVILPKFLDWPDQGLAFDVILHFAQCLLDVIESVSHQSGKPEPAVSIIQDVPYLQKSMFSHRTVAALSFMTGFFSVNGIYQYAVGNSNGILLPLILIPITLGIFMSYRKLAPSPELSILRVWNQ